MIARFNRFMIKLQLYKSIGSKKYKLVSVRGMRARQLRNPHIHCSICVPESLSPDQI